MLAAAQKPYYASGVLKPEFHDRLVQDIETYAEDASIQAKWIHTPLSEVCGPDEVDWARRFKKWSAQDMYGLYWHGKKGLGPDVETRMSAMAGCLVRNFIRARVMTVNQLLDSYDNGGSRPTALLVPNFFLGKNDGGDLPGWKVSKLYDILSERKVAGLQTLVYIASMDQMAMEYGTSFERLFKKHYKSVKF